MKKHEVLTLLERFPELVDSDELIHDLFVGADHDLLVGAESPEPAPHNRKLFATDSESETSRKHGK